MPKFEAESEALEYNFEPFQPGVKGAIPEPTSEQIEMFLEMLRKVMPSKEVDGEMVLDIDAVKTAFGEDGGDIEKVMAAAASDVCSNVFTPEQVVSLPFRVKQRFFGWLVGTLLRPEA